MPLFLMGCFPVDFQEVKRPLRTKSVKRPIKVGKRPINEGKRPIKAMVLVGISVGCLMGCFRSPPPWRKTAPLKRPIKRSMNFHTNFPGQCFFCRRVSLQNKPHVRNCCACSSGAGNGLANFMDAWHSLVLSAAKTPHAHQIPCLRGCWLFFVRGGSANFNCTGAGIFLNSHSSF